MTTPTAPKPQASIKPQASRKPPAEKPAPVETCPACRKPLELCICEGVAAMETRTRLLVLQHPQEQDLELGSARLAALHFENAVFRVGLSWASLEKALGAPADPKRWGVLYLGSSKPSDFPPGADVVSLDKKGMPLPDVARSLSGLDGIVVLDGTWSQAKTLWWRNAWMLKCRRLALAPARASLYGKLRREPRREALSSLESVAMLMAWLERKPEIEVKLLKSFETMLERYRSVKAGVKKPGQSGREA